MAARWLNGVSAADVRIDGHWIVFPAQVGAKAAAADYPTYRKYEVRIPIWSLRFLIRGARSAYRREAARMQEQAASITSAASREE